ncbi:hypothetical protein CDL15_Pgr016277 [Punica granatum]|uniref:Uncharacterized protein n=1 Tax=Punica granatum TaxID=22663 RepID=A0A218X0V2_PUNGR|nr:hypothetical protein CDL15_Pgr016277 [Punica granatum]PKI68845.1 hypothetical protein CRG98_010902 [Punica granatum]
MIAFAGGKGITMVTEICVGTFRPHRSQSLHQKDAHRNAHWICTKCQHGRRFMTKADLAEHVDRQHPQPSKGRSKRRDEREEDAIDDNAQNNAVA